MKRTTRLLALVLTMVMAFTACGGNTNTPNTEGPTNSDRSELVQKDTVVFSPRLDFATMDVQNTPSVVTKSIYYLVYNTLVDRDVATGAIVPCLAESWTMDSDTEYTFKLREGVKFHDGSDFTADDVKFTMEMALASKGSAGKLASLDTIEVVDPYTVKMTTKSVNMDFLDLLTDTSLSILSKTAFETLGDEEGIKQGTGPYKYVEWNQGSYLDLTAFDEYWGDAPATKNLRVQYISETSARLIAVQTGELDFCQDIPSSELANVAANPDLNLITYPSATVEFFAFNANSTIMQNQKVRQAIAYALNRDDFVTGIYMGNATRLNNIMHSSNAYYADIDAIEYDVEKAKSLLAEAGYPNGFEMTIVTNTTAESQAACTIAQSALDAIGITVKVDVMENAAVTTTLSTGTGYDMCFSRWSGYAFGPDNGIRQMLYTGGSNNYAHVSDAKMDELIDNALTITDETARKAAYKEIEEYSDELMYVYPVLVQNYTFVSGANVEGIVEPNGPIMNFRNVAAYK